MYCVKCGTELAEKMRFCPQCGWENTERVSLERTCSGGSRLASVLSMILAAFPFLMFLIPLQITIGSSWSPSHLVIDGYDTFFSREMLSIWWGEDSDAILIVNAGIFVIAVFLTVCNFAALIKGTDNRALNNVTTLISVFFSLLYCVEGIILVLLCHPGFKPMTFSYLALLLVGFIVVTMTLIKRQQQKKAEG